MAAGGYKEFVAGETLDEDEINDYLMQGVLVFAGTAARGSAITAPVEGQFAFLKDDDALTFYDGSQWAELSTTPGAAVVSGTTGSPTTGTVSSGGTTYNYYEWTGDGSITLSEAGFADVLVVGGGGSGGGAGQNGAAGGGGGGGGCFSQTIYMPAATHTVTVGAGGFADITNTTNNAGEPSGLGFAVAPGGGGAGSYANNFGRKGNAGGSGGGGGGGPVAPQGPGGAGITTQGFDGGTGIGTSVGGGGAGSLEAGNTDGGGHGGDGASFDLNGTPTALGGGGNGGGVTVATTGGGGIGGASGGNNVGGTGSANTGGGGGGGHRSSSGDPLGGNGGSGIVMIRVAV